MLRVALPVHVEGKFDEGAKALFTLPQLILGPLTLADIAHETQEPAAVLLELAGAHLDRKRGSVLAPMACLERGGLAHGDALSDALNGCLVEPDIEIGTMPADQLVPAVAETVAGLAVHVENGRLIIEQKESVGRIVDEGAEARLARAQLVLRPF